uniref:Cyclin T2a n=1 Tax=Sphaeramia orbicularis TaxID=375764 RepID=A0A673ADS8_9TELE
MAVCRGSSSKWFFTREQLENTPSHRCGVEPDRELSYRQQAANLIQDMGQRLNVSQLTINTAIVYMHRFYMHRSFTKFHRNIISPTTLFLAAKVEEQPRKLEHVIKVAHACLNPQEPPLDTKSNAYLQQAQELVILESIVLQTLGFEITIDHPHTDVVKCSQLVRASKDLAQTSYFMATNSLHLTTFCLQYKPTVIACVCIHLACKWSNWEIPVSTDGKHWWEYVDNTVTLELLDELTHEFLQILEKTPSRLKRIRNWRATQAAKKPKTESSHLADNSFAGPSMLQDHSQGESSLPGVISSNPGFSKVGTSFTAAMPGQSVDAALSLDTMTTTYNPASHSEWPQANQSQAGHPPTCIKQEHFSIPPQEPLSLQTSTSSLLPHAAVYRTDKPISLLLNRNKRELVGPLTFQPSPAQKLSLDKYREKQAAELSMSDHRKHSQPQLTVQHGHGSGSTTASPVKKAQSSTDRRHHSDKRDKGSLKVRLAVPGLGGGSLLEKGANKDELKMKIKVSSSEHHSSSEEGVANNNTKSKHSSPLISKEKQHRGLAEHNFHRHYKHSHPHSGNGRGGSDSATGLMRGPPGLVSIEGMSLAPSGATSSRKRVHPEVSHNHHPSSSASCSKTSKISKGVVGAPGTSPFSPPFVPPLSSLVPHCVSSGVNHSLL